jgi:CHASE2 domain-containing sensor protein
MIKNHLVRVLLSLLLAALFIIANTMKAMPLVDQLERIAYDWRLNLTLPGGVDPRLVIIGCSISTVSL